MRAFFSNGPNISLLERDVKFIRENGYSDFDFSNINGVLRISVVDRKISVGHSCEPGINIRRYPENISPYDYRGKQFWVIRLSKDIFEKLVNGRFDYNDDAIDSRCKYDRLCIEYLRGI
ncbi:hypothetical protein HYT25_04085 [Candidatus Pacearchaeota archaeon]|nr:hypothetical protein [Candidatus Pacearchaeota archaeon]